MPDPTTHAFPPGFTVCAALATAGFFLSASILFTRTDQTGISLPPDGPPPYLAKPDFGDPLTPILGRR
jgi:hypothetical protein